MGEAVVIEEWPMARVGLGVVLASVGVRVRTEAGTATQGFAALTAHTTLIVIGSCADATPRHAVRRAAEHSVGIVVMIPTADVASVLDLCSLGAHAVVPRDATAEEVATAAGHAIEGERYVPQRLMSGMFAPARPLHRQPSRPRFNLTQRETAVLTQLAAGRSNQEIADHLCIGAETVKTHLGNIYAKLAVRRRHHAVGVAMQHGLV